MRRSMKAAVLVTLALAASIYLVGCSSSPPPPMSLSQDDNGSIQNVQAGQIITVVLDADPTGPAWAIDGALPKELKQQGDPVFASTSLSPGAGGSQTWTFKAVSKGDTILKMKQWLPSKPKTPPSATFQVGMNIK